MHKETGHPVELSNFQQDVEMTAPPGDAAAGTGNGAEKKKFFPKKFGGVGMYFEIRVIRDVLNQIFPTLN